MVLFGALLAPGILAGGLLAGQARGFGERSDGGGAVGGGGAVAVMAFEPRFVSAPDRPQWMYGGFVPGVRRAVVRAEAVVVGGGEKDLVAGGRDASGAGRGRAGAEGGKASDSAGRGGGGERSRAEVEEPYTPVPVRPGEGCPGEWEETWLWEVCRAGERQDVQGFADGLLPRI